MDIYQVHAGSHLGIVGGFGEKIVAIDKKRDPKKAITSLIKRDFKIDSNAKLKKLDENFYQVGKIQFSYFKFNLHDLVDEVIT